MNALLFFLMLLFQGFIFTWICPFLLGPFMGLVMLATRKNSEKITPWTWFVIVIAFVGTAYVLWGWAAYIVHLSERWSLAPAVTQHWLYFVIGFLGCIGPLSSMAAGERNIGSSIHILLTSIAFITFCVWPGVSTALYGWIPALFG